MADTVPATPAAPTPATPAPPLKITVGQAPTLHPTLQLIAGPVVAILLFVGFVIWQRRDHAPEPAPTPVPLSIRVPADIQPYSLVRLTLAGPKADNAAWEVLFAQDVTRTVDTMESGDQAVFTGPPGSYRVSVWATVAGRQQHASANAVIPGPMPPTPGPMPGPTPTPTPPTPTPTPPGPPPLPGPGPLPKPGPTPFPSTSIQLPGGAHVG